MKLAILVIVLLLELSYIGLRLGYDDEEVACMTTASVLKWKLEQRVEFLGAGGTYQSRTPNLNWEFDHPCRSPDVIDTQQNSNYGSTVLLPSIVMELENLSMR